MIKRKVRPLPLTSERQINESVRTQNQKNKDRSKAMERRIAKVLRGRRIPMSGAAAQFKGDVEIPFVNFPGKYIIECKLSAQLNNRTSEPQIRISFAWFPKMHDEAKSMAAKFAVLIVHYQNVGNDYVFVRRDIVEKLITYYHTPFSVELIDLRDTTNVLDWRVDQKGKARSGYNVQRRELEAGMKDVKGFKGVRVLVPDGEYLVLHLDTYSAMVSHM